jgi:hypothetical protein
MPVQDSFDRADANPLSGNWATITGLGALRLVSNQCKNASGTDADSGARRTDGPFPDDQYAQITIASGDSTPDCGPLIRCAAAAMTMYGVFRSDATTRLWQVIAGSFTQIGSSADGAWNNGDRVRLTATGTTIKVLHNEVEIISVTDAAIAAGSPGLFVYEGATAVDDFECTDYIVPMTLRFGRSVGHRPAPFKPGVRAPFQLGFRKG